MKGIKSIISICVVMVMMLGMVPVSALPVTLFGDSVVEATDFNGLKTALTNLVAGESESNPTIILVKNDIDISSQIYMEGKHKKIISDGPHTIYRAAGFTGNMFRFRAGTTLIFGADGDNTNTLTFDSSRVTGASSPMIQAEDNSKVAAYNVTFKNNMSNGYGAIQITGAVFDFNGCTLTGLSRSSGNIGAVYADGGGVVNLNNTTISGNTAGEGSAIYNNGATVNFNSGSISGNGGAKTIYLNDRPTAIFNMYGGTIDGTGAYTTTGNLIYVRGNATANFYGGTIQNKNNDTSAAVSGEGTSTLNFNSGENGNGVVFKNCGAAAKNSNGGAVEVVGTVNMNAAVFDNCTSQYYGAISVFGGKLNISGNIVFENPPAANDYRGIRVRDHGNSALNLSANARIAAPVTVYLEANRKVNITSDITTDGAVAVISGAANGTTVLSGEISSNYSKFAAKVGANVCGVNSLGAVDTSVTAPEFKEPVAEDTVVLQYSGNTATVTANYDVGSALLIVAGYSAPGILDELQLFDVTVNNESVSNTVKASFADLPIKKLMLWEHMHSITPIASREWTESPTPGPTSTGTPVVTPTNTPNISPLPTSTPATASLGVGAWFALHPCEGNGINVLNTTITDPYFTLGTYSSISRYIVDKDGNYTYRDNDPVTYPKPLTEFLPGPYSLFNAAPFMDKYNGDVNITTGAGGKLTAASKDAVSMRYDIKVEGSTDTQVEYRPVPGLLEGVDTQITLNTQNYAGDIMAIVKYDNGLTHTVSDAVPAGTPNGKKRLILPGGPFKSVESVIIKPKKTGSTMMPSVEFLVVSDIPGEQTPLSFSKYVKPNLNTETPPPLAPNPAPTPSIVSPLSINEILAGSTAESIVDKFGKRSDWIELYNSSDQAIDLTGYGLTDSPKKPKKWVFPSGSTIEAKEYLVVFASEADTVKEGELHTNFALSKEGETVVLSDPQLNILSVMRFPAIKDNTTFARVPDGSNTFKNTNSTPRLSNNGAEVISTYVEPPEFSAQSGFYQQEFDLDLTAGAAAIYYTTDGSEPKIGKEGTKQYTGSIRIVRPPFEGTVLAAEYRRIFLEMGKPTKPFAPGGLDKNMTIRAISVDESGNESKSVTKSYFVGYDMANDFNNAMILSVTTDMSNLLGPETGIWLDDWKWELEKEDAERPAHINIFEGDGSQVVDQDIGIQLRGGASRTYQQKGFNFHARSEYGAKWFDYPLFPNAYDMYGNLITSHRNFAIRNGGQQQGGIQYLDGACQRVAKDLAEGLDIQDQRPAIMFLNGEYWGVYYMSERVTDTYLENHYKIPQDDVIVIKRDTGRGEATAADEAEYNELRNWARNTDFSKPENLAILKSKIDLENLMLYCAANIATANNDWTSYNVCAWRSRYNDHRSGSPLEDGKWRFFFYDMDCAYMDESANKNTESDMFTWTTRALISNPALRDLYINTICDVFSATFSFENVADILKYRYDEYVPLTARHYARWNISSNAATGEFDETLKVALARPSYHYKFITEFFTKDYPAGRPNYYKGHMDNLISLGQISSYPEFNLSGVYAHLNVRVNDGDMGRVKVNIMNPDFSEGRSYTARYFVSINQTLEAIPAEGYRFVKWEWTKDTIFSDPDKAVTNVQIPETGSRVTAIFEPVD